MLRLETNFIEAFLYYKTKTGIFKHLDSIVNLHITTLTIANIWIGYI